MGVVRRVSQGVLRASEPRVLGDQVRADPDARVPDAGGLRLSGVDRDQGAGIVRRLAVAGVPVYQVRRLQQSLEVVVMDLSEDRSEPRVFINPTVEVLTHDMGQYQEGCLSVPGFYDKVTRAAQVRVRATGVDGKPFELEAEGLLAVCIQHEMDHLLGNAFVDYLSPLKRARVTGKLRKKQRLAG